MYNQQNTEQKKKQGHRGRGAQRAFKHLPFVYFIGLLTLVYIANVHKAEKKIRVIEDLEEEVSEKSWEYQSLKSDVNYQGIQSSTEQRVKASGLKPLKAAPKQILISEQEK